MRHIMLDLETMGTAPGSAIVQIGAVDFSVYKIGDPFSVNVDLTSCVNAGLRIEPRTVMWWMLQNDDARKSLAVDCIPLRDALAKFSEWIGSDTVAIWGDGAAFDNVLLASAYRVTKMPMPWHYANDRCYRTLKNLFPVERILSDVLHNATADAIAQAKQVQAIVAKYGVRIE
jgi:hypothetical protein